MGLLSDLVKKKDKKRSNSEFDGLDTMFEFEKEMKRAGGC